MNREMLSYMRRKLGWLCGRAVAGSGRTRQRLLIALGVLLASMVARPASASDKGSAQLLGQITGRYRFVGGKTQRRGVKRAIERVVSQMNFLIRGFARSRLEETNRVASKISIDRQGERITISFDERTYTAPLDGRTVWVKGVTGDKVKLKLRAGRKRLLQVFIGDRGQRANAFLPGNRRTLVLKVTISSDRLPGDIRYRLTYAPIGKS